MNRLQRYINSLLLGPFVMVLGALSLVALLTQGMTRLDLMVGNRGSAEAFFSATALAMPQLIATLMPVAAFIAAVFALNRFIDDSEAAVTFSSGLSRWGVAAPLLRLGAVMMIVHLIINIWLQPMTYRAMRHVIFDARADIAASLVRAGQFMEPAAGLTIYAGDGDTKGRLRNIVIHDERNGEVAVTTTAREGRYMEDGPSLFLREGLVQTREADGKLRFVDFDETIYPLTEFAGEERNFFYKPSDRYLHELFAPDMTQHYEQKNAATLRAEGVDRLASPFLNPALLMLAAGILLGGDLGRAGAGRKIVVAAFAGLTALLGSVALQAAAETNMSLTIAQAAWPALVFLIGAAALMRRTRLFIPKVAPAKRARKTADAEAAVQTAGAAAP